MLATAMAESFDDAFLELLNPTYQDEEGNVIISEVTDPIYSLPNTDNQIWLNYSMMAGSPIVLNDSVSFAFQGSFLDSQKQLISEDN